MNQCSNAELQAIVSLQANPDFKLLVNVLERRKERCKEHLLYVTYEDLDRVQQLYHALSSVLATVKDAEAMLDAEEQEKLDLNNSVYKFRQTGD